MTSDIRIETDRLILRAPCMEDFEACAAFLATPRSKNIGAGNMNRLDAWRVFSRIAGMWFLRGYSLFVVEDKVTGKSLAAIGPWNPITWPGQGGRGYALEATDRVRLYLYNKLGWDGAVSYVDPKNLEAIRLAERLGAVKDKTAPSVDGHDVCYRHPSPSQLASSQIEDGIAMEIAHYADPLFKMKGVPVD